MIKHIDSKFNSRISNGAGGAASGIGGILFGVVWICFSSIFVAVGIGSTWKSLRQSAWQSVPCVIEEFQILDDPNQEAPFSAKLTFRYEVDGREHRGHHLYPPKPSAVKMSNKMKPDAPVADADAAGREKEYQKLARLQRQYLTTTVPLCLVDRNDPDRAALMVNRGEIWGGLAFGGFGLCFVGIGVGVLLQGIRQVRAGRGGATGGQAVTGSGRDSSQFPRLIGVPFCGLFAVAGCGMFYAISVPIIKSLVTSSSWIETPATVVWSRVTSSSGSHGSSSYKADVFYQYAFDGKTYKSNRSDMIEVSSSGSSGKQEDVRANPPGKAIVCYVNPHQPWDAVRKRSLGWSALFGLFPLPFMAVGLGGLWFMVRQKNISGTRALTGTASRGASWPTDRSDSDAMAGSPSAALRLSPGKGRLTGFLGMVFVAVFWNGIVSVFLWQVVSQWHSGHVPWFLTLFLTPFVCIGIGLLLAAVHALGALFNPRPLVTLTPGQPRLGQPLTVAWQFPSGSERLSRLRIVLRGEEVTTLQRGDNNASARTTFHEAVLIESTLPQMIATGRATTTLPANLMPSSQFLNNRIEWTLRIEGNIRLWPDLADSHVLTIHAGS